MQNNALKQQEPRTRIIGVLEYYGRSTLLDILHNPIHSNLPRDPKKLFKLLKSSHIKKLEALKKKGIIKSKQWNLIFPPNINETDSGNFDLTLFRILIQMCTSLPPPTNGWTKSPAKQDKSTAAYVLRLVSFRDELYHSASIILAEGKFNQLWKKLTKYLDRLGCITDVQHLKASPLDCLGIDHVKAQQEILRIHLESQVKHIKAAIMFSFIICLIFILGLYIFWNNGTVHNYKDQDLHHRMEKGTAKLKNYYLSSIGKENVDRISQTIRNQQRFYVDLAVVDSIEVDVNNSKTARDFHIQQHLSARGTYKITELLDDSSQITLLRGIGGIGKTFMMKTVALHWAQGRIWKDLQFIFFFSFRELNLFRGVSSFKELLLKKYSFVFHQLSVEEIFDISEHILVIFDGFDEFVYANNISVILKSLDHHSVNEIAKAVYDALNPYGTLLPGHKTIITTRPTTISLIRSAFSESSLRELDILGFDSSQVSQYIDLFIQNESPVSHMLKDKIEHSSHLKVMSTVPVYLWTLCSLFQEQNMYEVPTTITELFVWQLALFLQRHYKTNILNAADNVFNIFTIPSIQELIHGLSFVAHKMLLKGVILIHVSELPDVIKAQNLEATGLISGISTVYGKKYQFNHLMMQEFLTALYYFIFSENGYELMLYKNLKGCVTLAAGIEGALKHNSRSPKVLIQFVQALGLHLFNNMLLNIPHYVLRYDEKYILETLYEYHNPVDELTLLACQLNPEHKCHVLDLNPKDQHELVYFLENYGDILYVRGIEFPLRYTPHFTQTELTKIIKHICSVPGFHLHTIAFYQESLEYLFTSLEWYAKHKSQEFMITTWKYLMLEYACYDFVRDFGDTTLHLFNVVWYYTKVYLVFWCESQNIIEQMHQSLLATLKEEKNGIRLTFLQLNMEHID